ncbi:hypothetical protein C0971_06040 [Bacillus methanolicus]|uniref:hypothetical protein n=1 Tax=Bacillus methanolicus TaxID=1471 RepID=UPI00200FC51C|nr:hypothetical protein [Bacillus methanolicus]UQD51639.1 hypothetical protein C0971_06040 [Bacillus methanolicus]
MENQHNEIYSELRKMKAELEEKSKRKISNELIKEFIQEEIQDIEYTLKKIETGEFGKCEISGELIPFHYLTSIPTLRSAKDIKKVERFYKKSFYS